MIGEIYINLLLTITLVFLLAIIGRTQFIKKQKSKYYRNATIGMIVILLCYVFRLIAINTQTKWLSIITNFIIYGFAPFVPYCLCLSSLKKIKKREIIFIIVLFINVVIAFVSIFTGWYFKCSSDQVYARGSIFYVAYIITAAFALDWIILSLIEYKQVSLREKLHLIGLFALLTVGTILQTINLEIKSIWITNTMVILLYYAFIIEVSSRYDELTELQNRNAYINKVSHIKKSNQYNIVIFDLNGLKNINDTFGHEAGDHYIIKAARFIRKYLPRFTNIYRIGGDEFVAFTSSVLPEDELVKICDTISENLINYGKQIHRNLSLSYGVATHSIVNLNDTFETIFNLADKRMYTQKQKYYKNKNITKEKSNLDISEFNDFNNFKTH